MCSLLFSRICQSDLPETSDILVSAEGMVGLLHVQVYANDLNPRSYHWLAVNMKLNKARNLAPQDLFRCM